ncbi:aquaporin AQPAe.a-like [Asbolus verrucosus]|uniref:Aquaporin AQPAe.a-like n=1 Tax=Asbolus verrucosus TaxID=1661398 RepID=A0A482VCQ1_ASBVE|nr:aquaporin AQPAe.a-like [Asbolus verrucosus]
MTRNCLSDAEVAYKKKNTSVWLTGMTIGLAEFVGTALLVFLTCMGCTKGMSEGSIPVLQLSLASGLSVTTAIQIFGHISGAHVNPAITLCAVIMGEISLTSVPIYVGSQIAGSLTGYALLTACLVEFTATVILAFAVCASWDPKNSNNTDAVPLKIGFIVVLLNITAVYWLGPVLGAALTGQFYKKLYLRR